MHLIVFLSLLVFVAILGVMYYYEREKTNWKTPKGRLSPKWQRVMAEKVAFYNSLNKEEKARFEYKVAEFLLNHHIVGVGVEINWVDKMLVGASAIIPIFKFPDWRYDNLFEVLIYPDHFNEKFETTGDGRNILGMVGTGYLEGKMILSRRALHQGFANEYDKRNTAIHEFVHLVDMMDGTVDGIPSLLLEKQYAIPWLDLMKQKINEIEASASDIRAYGATNGIEFFAVASEYFFEHPKALQYKHPQLYELLESIFQHDMAERNQWLQKRGIGRNAPCLCGSGLKYKNCCA